MALSGLIPLKCDSGRLMCAWTEMVMLKQRGVDCVCRLISHQKADFRRGKRMGEGGPRRRVAQAAEAAVD